MPIFTIDGNIGSGKSTLIDYFHSHFRISVDPEPVEKWQPYLDDIYNLGKGAFEFQVRVWLDRCLIQQRPNMAPIVMERSPFFQTNVFLPANLENGKLSVREYHMLHEMYAKSSALWAPYGLIYLRSNPLKCMERIRKRARPSEENITIQYLLRIHQLHEQSYFHAIALGIPVICIDVENKSIPHIAAEVWSALCVLGFTTNTSST